MTMPPPLPSRLGVSMPVIERMSAACLLGRGPPRTVVAVNPDPRELVKVARAVLLALWVVPEVDRLCGVSARRWKCVGEGRT
jgi:hypothetical protein